MATDRDKQKKPAARVKMPRERQRSEMEKVDSLVSQVQPLRDLTVSGYHEVSPVFC